jgi:hypothetical protein
MRLSRKRRPPKVDAGRPVEGQAGDRVRTSSPRTKLGPGDRSGTVTWELVESEDS